MLVFTRKRDESLIIGTDIEITILSISSGNVKVGITAPRHISVHRQEVFEAIKRENLAAAQSKVPQTEIFKNLFKEPGNDY